MPVIDRRRKNENWHVVEGDGTQYTNINAQLLAVLQDIRDELKMLKNHAWPLRHLECGAFLNMPLTLARIARNTAKPKRRKQAK